MKLVSSCFQKPEPVEPSYCGVNKVIVNNGSSTNYLVGIGDDTDAVNEILEADPDEAVNIRVAFRYVSGSVLITSNGKDIVPVTPGTERAMNETYRPFEIWYLPLTYKNKNPREGDFSDSSAHKMFVTNVGRGPVNVELDLLVKPGYYRLSFPGNPFFHEFRLIKNPSEEAKKYNGARNMNDKFYNDKVFVLKKPEDTRGPGTNDNQWTLPQGNTKFCAKITRNFRMEGGTPDSKDNNVGDCKLSSTYQGMWNNACGGISGTNENNFWKSVGKSNGKKMYERIFGTKFSFPSGSSEYMCREIFPSTVFMVNCENANNQDVNAQAAITYNKNNSSYKWSGGDADYFSKTDLSTPISGKAMYYDAGWGLHMENVNNEYKHKPLKDLCADCDGTGAMLRAGDKGRTICMKVIDATSKANGQSFKLFMRDVAGRSDIPDLFAKGWVIDVDYAIGLTLGMIRIGPKMVELSDPNANGQCN